MKNVYAMDPKTTKGFDAGSFDAVKAGAAFANAIEETGQAIYLALESIARGIEVNFKGDAQKIALSDFLAAFDAAFYAASVKRKTAILLARTRQVKLSDGEKADIEASAKNITKATKSLYKKALEIRLFKDGGTIDRNAREYTEDHALSVNGGKKKPREPKTPEAVNKTADIVKTLAGFDSLLAAVLDAGIDSGNPEVVAKAETIKGFLASQGTGKKKTAPTLGDLLVAVA